MVGYVLTGVGSLAVLGYIFKFHIQGRLRTAVMMLAPSVLSEAAPNYSRTLAAVPPVMLGAVLPIV